MSAGEETSDNDIGRNKRLEAEEQPLPAGWQSAISRRHGRRFYYHRTSSLRTWTRPVASIVDTTIRTDSRLRCEIGQPMEPALEKNFLAIGPEKPMDVSAAQAGEEEAPLGSTATREASAASCAEWAASAVRAPGTWELEEAGGWTPCDPAVLEPILKMCEAVRNMSSFDAGGFHYELEFCCGVRRSSATGRCQRLRRRACNNEASVVDHLEAPPTSRREPRSVSPVMQNRVVHPAASSSSSPKRRRFEFERENGRRNATAVVGAARDSKCSLGNETLIEVFEEMGAVYRVKRDFWRARALERAVEAVRGCAQPILSGSQARRINGIGDGIARRIDEVLTNGELQELAELKRDDDIVALRELRAVHGIGAVRAAELMEKGIRSLDDLREAVSLGRVRLDGAQSVGLRYVAELRRKIPRDEMTEHAELVQRIRDDWHPSLLIMVCGSYRRGKAFSGDIDVLITDPQFVSASPAAGRTLLRDFVRSLWRAGYLSDDLATGEKKYMGVCRLLGDGRLHRRIDIRCFPFDHFHFGTLYFTGSASLNVRMRLRALELGLALSEYGLEHKGQGTLVLASSEREIFERLGIDYLEPTER